MPELFTFDELVEKYKDMEKPSSESYCVDNERLGQLFQRPLKNEGESVTLIFLDLVSSAAALVIKYNNKNYPIVIQIYRGEDFENAKNLYETAETDDIAVFFTNILKGKRETTEKKDVDGKIFSVCKEQTAGRRRRSRKYSRKSYRKKNSAKKSNRKKKYSRRY